MRLEMSFVRLLLTLALLALPQPVLAAAPIIVGNGTPASCTEMALKHALIVADTAGGGTIRFRCGRGPVTIALREATEIQGMKVLLVLPNNTTIDGSGLIALDGTRTGAVAFVDRDTTVVLKDLSIINGGERFGGTLVGGGIFNRGTLAVHGSTLSDNLAVSGGGIRNEGTLAVEKSTFSHNIALSGGGIFNLGGTVTVANTTFADNPVGFTGGGISNFGTLTVEKSTFSHNFGDNGAGIFNGGGTATVAKTIFADNFADLDGGAIVNRGTLTIDHSTLSENSSSLGGGAITNFGTLTIDHSTLSGNTAEIGRGGAISNFGALTVDHSTLSGNAVDGQGVASSTRTRSPSTTAPSVITPRSSWAAVSISVLRDRWPP